MRSDMICDECGKQVALVLKGLDGEGEETYLCEGCTPPIGGTFVGVVELAARVRELEVRLELVESQLRGQARLIIDVANAKAKANADF